MSEEAMVRNCAPTLAGIKTGNLFSYRYDSIDEMLDSVRFWNVRLREKGIRILPLRYRKSHALIYLYRPAHLADDLHNEEAKAILRLCGYKPDTAEKCIAKLMQRLQETDDFPHEIGLFLGYPPEDVKGFMKNPHTVTRKNAAVCLQNTSSARGFMSPVWRAAKILFQ